MYCFPIKTTTFLPCFQVKDMCENLLAFIIDFPILLCYF